MATENTPDEAVAADQAEPVKKRPARRRVTRTPVSAEVGEPAAVVAEPVTQVAPVAEPAPKVPVAQTLSEAATDVSTELTAAPRARRSRRVTRTVVLPVEPEVLDEAPVVEVAAPAAEEADPDETVAEETVADEPGAQPQAADQSAAPVAAAPDAPALDVLAELSGLRAAAPAPAPVAARLAATALLFQPPEPTSRTRRRRAQAAAGSPQEVSQGSHVVPTSAQEPAARDLADSAVAPSDEDVVAEDVEVLEAAASGRAPQSTSGRGGRSGGRRRGRSKAAEAVAELVGEQVEALEPSDEVEEPEDADTEAATSDEGTGEGGRRRRRRGGRGRRARSEQTVAGGEDDEDESGADTLAEPSGDEDEQAGEQSGSGRRRRRRRRGGRGEGDGESTRSDEVTALRGSTRLEAKRQRRRDGRDAGRRRQTITEAEFLARRESVDRVMVVRERAGRTQIAVLEDGVLVEHYVSNQAAASMVGNVYLGRVQNVLPSMEAAFVDVGKGRNAVLYAGEVNWDAAGLDGQPRRIEQALKSGDQVLVQVTKDPIGHKGARLTSQVTLAGRYLVLVPGGGMTGISHKLPDVERNRLKKILRAIVPEAAGVIVRTAAEGASEEELAADIERLQAQWDAISAKAKSASAPALLQGEPDMAIRVVRDIFNDDFSALVVAGQESWSTISAYIGELAPDLAAKVTRWTGEHDVFASYRVDEQLAKGMDRKVWLPSGGSLVIDRTEAMTVVDVNTGKFTGSGGTLEETVTRNNLEAAEEIVRQLRLRDIGGMIVIDFIDMVLASNRDLVLRRLVECLGRDRTKHQVAEVTTLGLVQMTRKRVGQGLVEAFSETCEHCHGRGFIVHTDPIEKNGRADAGAQASVPAETTSKRSRRKKASAEPVAVPVVPVLPEAREAVKATLATIAAAAAHAHEHHDETGALPVADAAAGEPSQTPVVDETSVEVAPSAGPGEAEPDQV
ncbi:Rne/Rng family ribonuclease [Cellulomonas citrea]|uniref:Rne/Rng family ribonuclease n=1 Tax=Cellulomonas citrea TaxID=1909423 RepID=UPI00191694BE|nr:Rne/Rng family ribonuclease [Cellulomonas citrea]